MFLIELIVSFFESFVLFRGEKKEEITPKDIVLKVFEITFVIVVLTVLIGLLVLKES